MPHDAEITLAKVELVSSVGALGSCGHLCDKLICSGVCVDVDPSEGVWNLHILVDYCDGGSLSRLICDKQRAFPWLLRCNLAKDISCAMNYVHSKNIMHRDLTSMVGYRIRNFASKLPLCHPPQRYFESLWLSELSSLCLSVL